MRRILSNIFYMCPGVILLFACSCDNYFCGDGYYHCDDIITTEPHGRPLALDIEIHYVLLENNRVAILNNTNDYSSIIDLNNISPNDTIFDAVLNHGLWFLMYRSKCVHCRFNSYIGECYFEFEFGNMGDSTGILNAVAVDADSAGNIYIVDSADNTVKIFDRYGQFVSIWQDIGEPTNISIADDWIYLIDNSDHKIKKYDFDGEYQETMFEDFEFYDITAYNSFIVADHGGQRLLLMSDPPEIKLNYCFMDAEFNFISINDIVDGAFGFWVVDSGTNMLIAFAPESKYRYAKSN